jgi:formylglycine-generating enzyme required for sulfatase activity
VILLAIAFAILAGARLRAPTPRTPPVWEDPVTGMRFNLIMSQSFMMGTPQEEPGREAQETRHEVTISRAFYLGAYEVTQAQWTRVMGANPSHFQSCAPTCPVESVSWSDVQQFVARLNARSRPGFRLPTEAEWELACRAGGIRPFGATDVMTSQFGNINGNFPYNGPKGSFRGRPLPVGTFPANAWQFFDMSGNVWEWTEDEYCSYPAGAARDPVGACGSTFRVIRGGSWAFDGNSARCGTRYTHRPQDRGYSLGVRLAHDVW